MISFQVIHFKPIFNLSHHSFANHINKFDVSITSPLHNSHIIAGIKISDSIHMVATSAKDHSPLSINDLRVDLLTFLSIISFNLFSFELHSFIIIQLFHKLSFS